MREVVLASRNAKKLAELKALLEPLGLRLRAAGEFGGEAPEEPAPTFVENALIKARDAARAAGLPALADDSGIEVDALGGAPGVRSARYAGEGASDADNNARLLQALAEVPDAARGAGYVCVLALVRHPDDPVPVLAEGRWRGRILREPRGTGGFGYDPLFWVASHGCSAAELAPAVKNRLSHRARAAAALLARLRGS
jgi:XTP/dITP diphosphohydrolase